MRTIVTCFFALIAALSLGCAHKPAASASVAAVSAPSAPSPELPKDAIGAALQDAQAKLSAYQAVYDLEDWANAENHITIQGIGMAEERIEKAGTAIGKGWKDNRDPQYLGLLKRWHMSAHVVRVKCAETALFVLRAFASKNPDTYGTAEEAIAIAVKAVANAAAFHGDEDGVGTMRSSLVNLSGKARVAFAERTLDRLQKCVDGKDPMFHDAVSYAEAAVVAAVKAGDDVGTLVTRLQKLRQAACAKDETVCIR